MSDLKFSSPSLLLPNLSLARQQKGMALMMVLLLVVSITIVAGSMLANQKLTTRKSGLLFEQDRLIQQIDAGERMAVEIIKADSQVNDFDSFQDVWAEEMPVVKTSDDYEIEINITDASARFNLNNLYHDGLVDEQALQSFQRLLDSLGLDRQLAVAVLDWQDPDTSVYNDGGDELIVYNNAYSNEIANQPFVSIEQLASLPDVTAETLATLRPYVTAVPYWLPVNVNTAEQLVIKSVVGEGNIPAVQTLINERETQPISSREMLEQLNLFSGDNNNSANNTTVSSGKIEDASETENNPTGQEQPQSSQQQNNTDDESPSVNRAKQKALLDVKSSAFQALIRVSKGEKNNQKTRFVTIMIAKGEIIKDKETQTSGGQNGNQSDLRDNTTNQADALLADNPVIKAFSRRTWAFRPTYMSP